MTYGMLSKLEIEALQPPPNMSVAEWVEAHRILPRGNAEPGPKRISRTPSLRAVYDWFYDFHIREITCQKPAQCGFTDLVVDLILWICENDPSPTALFLADRETAIKIMKYRILPAFKEMGKIGGGGESKKTKDATKFECNFSNGFYLMVSWGSSIAQTASMAFKYVFCDEINKPGYDANKDEGAALGRIKQRTETYPDSKFVKFSTPTVETGHITVELAKADVVFDYQVPCPYCGGLNILNFKNVSWQGGSEATREQIKNARYTCEHCGEAWDSEEKNKAVEHGQFVARKAVDRPTHVGLQLHRLSSLFKGGRLENMVKLWIDAQKEGPLEIQNVINSAFGEAWVNRTSAPEGERMSLLNACIADIQPRIPPQETLCLVAGVDVQQDGFWYRIRAFAADLTSWGIDEGFVATWTELRNILTSTYGGHSIWRCLIDTGGGKENGKLISRTEETYEFIRANKGVIRIMGAKGSSQAMPTKIKIGTPIDKTPSGKPIIGGIRIVQINTDAFKDLFWWRVEKAKDGEPGAIYFHNETPDYVFKHLTAEEKRIDKNGREDWVAVRKDNHLFDCECLCLACVNEEFYGGIRAAGQTPIIKHNQPKPQEYEPQQAEPRHNHRNRNDRGENPYTRGIY